MEQLIHKQQFKVIEDFIMHNRYGVVICGVIWYGLIRYVMAWHGMAEYDYVVRGQCVDKS